MHLIFHSDADARTDIEVWHKAVRFSVRILKYGTKQSAFLCGY
jgi:hypothetical protein